jgi:hypothetical protein
LRFSLQSAIVDPRGCAVVQGATRRSGTAEDQPGSAIVARCFVGHLAAAIQDFCGADEVGWLIIRSKNSQLLENQPTPSY